MTNRINILAIVLAAVAICFSAWAMFVGPFGLKSNGGQPGFGAAGNLLAEQYIPYVLYNGGYNSAKDFAISGSSAFSGAVTNTSTWTLGSSGTAMSSIYHGTCQIGILAAQTITASTTVMATCGSGFNGATALTGLTSTSRVFLQAPTTTPGVLGGTTGFIFVTGAGASTTAGFIHLNVSNLGAGTWTWTAAASSSWQYLIIN